MCTSANTNRQNFDAPYNFLRFLTLLRFSDIRRKCQIFLCKSFCAACFFIWFFTAFVRLTMFAISVLSRPTFAKLKSLRSFVFAWWFTHSLDWEPTIVRATNFLYALVVAFGLPILCYLFILERWLTCHTYTHVPTQIQHPFRIAGVSNCPETTGAVASRGCCAVSSSASGNCASEHAMLTSFAHLRTHIQHVSFAKFCIFAFRFALQIQRYPDQRTVLNCRCVLCTYSGISAYVCVCVCVRCRGDVRCAWICIKASQSTPLARVCVGLRL